MKKLLLTLLATLSIAAHADGEFRWSPNTGGGAIYLTTKNCVLTGTTIKVQGSYEMYTTDEYGNIMAKGCYYYDYPFYRARYTDGLEYVWRVDSFKPILR